MSSRRLARGDRRVRVGGRVRGARGRGVARFRHAAASRPPTWWSTRSPRARSTRVRGCFDDHGLSVSSLAYYGNNLHPDADERRATNDHVARCIDAAAALGSPTVGTFIGRDPNRSVAENLLDAETIFPPLVDGGTLGGCRHRDRELRDGGMAPRRLSRQPRVLARAVGVDVHARVEAELRSVAPHVAGHRSGQRAAAVRRARRARAGEGHPARPATKEPVRVLRQGRHP